MFKALALKTITYIISHSASIPNCWFIITNPNTGFEEQASSNNPEAIHKKL